jgi:hypothetical protein
MGQTDNYQLSYPDPESTVDVARDIMTLAVDVDANITKQLPWTPTVTGLTRGNGTVFGEAYEVGDLVVLSLRIRAAAASPTTAWQSVNTFVNLPRAVKQAASSSAYFVSGSGRLGMVLASVGATTLTFSAISSTLTTVAPGNAAGWGTAVWAANGEFLTSVAYVGV